MAYRTAYIISHIVPAFPEWFEWKGYDVEFNEVYSDSLHQMKTRVFLMHDRDDPFIPVEEPRKIRDVLPKNIPLSYSEISIFSHVTLKARGNLLELTKQLLPMAKLLLWEG